MYTCSVCNNPTIATSMTMDFIEVNYADGSITHRKRVCGYSQRS